MKSAFSDDVFFQFEKSKCLIDDDTRYIKDFWAELAAAPGRDISKNDATEGVCPVGMTIPRETCFLVRL